MLYFAVDLIHECNDEGVEVPQEKGKDSAQLPLEGNAGMVVLQGTNHVKHHWAEHTKQRHHHVDLNDNRGTFHTDTELFSLEIQYIHIH